MSPLLTLESPETLLKAKSISDYHEMRISGQNRCKRISNRRLDRNTLIGPRVVRHALLLKYGLLIAQDSFVGQERGRVPTY